MTAFLSAWLSEFGSRVVNRPSPAYLAGPPWSNEEWLIRAARRGVRTVDVVRGSSVGGARAPIDHWVTFVGDHAFGQTRGLDTDAVRGLAQSAGVKFFSIGLCAESGSPAVAAVDLTPPAGSAEVRDALLRLLRAARS